MGSKSFLFPERCGFFHEVRSECSGAGKQRGQFTGLVVGSWSKNIGSMGRGWTQARVVDVWVYLTHCKMSSYKPYSLSEFHKGMVWLGQGVKHDSLSLLWNPSYSQASGTMRVAEYEKFSMCVFFDASICISLTFVARTVEMGLVIFLRFWKHVWPRNFRCRIESLGAVVSWASKHVSRGKLYPMVVCFCGMSHVIQKQGEGHGVFWW